MKYLLPTKHLHHLVLIAAITLLTPLTACTSFMAATNDGPITEDYGVRTRGTAVEDDTIESKAEINISRTNETLHNSHIEIKSFNRVVLLTGQVPDKASKQLCTQVVEKIRHVRRVHNELEISGSSGFLSRTNDIYIATKTNSRLMAADDIESDRIEVIVENGNVYLMGLVTQDEAQRTVNVVQNVSGIQKIVKVFEYISSEVPI